MAGYTCVRVAPIKSLGGLKKSCEHNTRKEGEKTPAHINKDKMNLNQMLVGTWEDNFVKMCKDEINASAYYETHDVRKNAVYGMEVEIHYPGDKNDDKEKIDKWASMTAEWIQNNFGKDNVKNIVLHMDEAQPHIHAVAIPMYENEKGDRKLSYYHFIDGPSELSRLQTNYATYIKELGFSRGIKASPANHQDMKKVHDIIHKAFSKEPPEIKKGENVEQYRERIKTEWQELYAKTAILENEKIRDGDIKKVDVKKDNLIDNLRVELDAAQVNLIKLQEENHEYKKREYLIEHGIAISRVENLRILVDDLKCSLIEDAERDLREKHIYLDELLK